MKYKKKPSIEINVDVLNWHECLVWKLQTEAPKLACSWKKDVPKSAFILTIMKNDPQKCEYFL